MMGAWDYRYNEQGGALPRALQGVAGAVTARYAYDPFGKRRFTNGTYDAVGTLVVDWTSNTHAGTDRGYTGHEHLDDAGLVHMNGRIFDPTLGVFLQGDPFIQDPGNLQNYNRYGYCFNNPLTCTDPSGQDFGFGHLLVLVYMAWVADQMPEFRPYVAIFAAVVLGPAGGAFPGGAAAYGMSQAATAGFVSGAIATGNLQGALQGAFTAGMFNGAGNLIGGGDFFTGAGASAKTAWTNPLAGIALHAVVGCVTSAAGGGKCGPGALSASFSKAFAGEIMSKAGDAGVIASAVIGGTASVLGGGKFASGAMSGAFGYLFNELPHETTKTQRGYTRVAIAVGDGLWGEALGDQGSNPFGHVAIAVTDNGVFSFGTSTPLGSDFQTYLDKQSKYRGTTVYVFDVLPQQAAAIVDTLRSYGGQSLGEIGSWDSRDSCASRTMAALRSAGIKQPFAVIPDMFPTAPKAAGFINATQTYRAQRGALAPVIPGM